ncbi:MAG: hypothetical protein R6U56_09905 [Opitutales bacterium]
MNEESTVDPEETRTPPSVLLVPGHLFFVDRIDLPDALESSEISDFAELSLESLAPFPVEQLYWGYLYSKSAGSILLYASYKERIKAQGYQDIETYLWVLPDFATLFGAYFPETITLQLESEESLSQITFPAEDSLPRQIVPSPHPAKLDAKQADLRLKLESTKVSEQGLPTFHFQPLDADTESVAGTFGKLSPGEDELWRADIRDANFKKNERSARKFTARITRATVYAALFAILLVMLEGILFLGELWLDTQDAKIAGQTPEVRRIEDKQSLMNKLDQVAQNELRPIAALEALNQVRPEGIYFTGTVTEEQNRIIVDGIANTINELNKYTDALLASGSFNMPDNPRTLTRGGKTTFTATFDYIHTDVAAGGAEEEEEEEEEEENPEADPEEDPEAKEAASAEEKENE